MTSREEFTAWYLAAMIDLLGKGIESQARLNLEWLRDDGTFADPSLRLALMAWEAARNNSQPVGTFSTPESGHAIPQWLRDQFSSIEDEAMRMGGCAVFTQMRTKVQAYFEMLRADLSYAVVLAERDQLKAKNDALRSARTVNLPEPLPSGDYRMTVPFYKAADVHEALSAAGIEVKP